MSSFTLIQHHLTIEAESAINRQIAQVRRQTSIRGLVQYRNPRVPSHLRCMISSMPSVRKLNSISEEISINIVSKQIAEAQKLPLSKGVEMLNSLANSEWRLLSGNFPKALAIAERSRRDLQLSLNKEIKSKS